MKYTFIVLVLLCYFYSSCTPPSQTEKDLRDALNTELQLKVFDLIRKGNAYLSLGELKQQYEFLSVIYLENGCSPCYPKFISWHHKMDSITVPDNYSMLFVIKGDSYEDFMTEVLNIDYVEDKYYTIMDPEGKFLEANKDIPRWIIDASVLIDSENKIKMVGAPWANADMTELFYKTVSSHQ